VTLGAGSVDLGSAYGRIEIDWSQVEAQMNRAFGTVEQQTEGVFARIGGRIQSAGDQVAGWGSELTKLMAPVAAAGAVGIRTFASYEDVLAEIRARTGATADEMARVDEMALQMGADTKYSSTQAAEAMLQLLSSGYDLNQTFAALPGVLNAAAASGMDLGFTADVVTDALAMWKLGAEDANRVSDALARGASASSAEISDLALGLGNVGPIAAQFGLSIEDTVAILAAFSERGIKGAEAGTQLRSMLSNMTSDTDKVNGMWQQLGISMFDAQGQVRPLNTVMGELRERMAGMTEQEQIETIRTLAGAYGQQGLAILTSSDAMGDMSALMVQQQDAATVAAARQDTLNGRTEAFRGSLETLMIKALRPFIDQHLKPGIVQMTEFVNLLTEWVIVNPVLTTQIVRILSFLVALGPALFTTGKAISYVGKMISGVGTVIGWVGSVVGFVLSPMGLILIGIAAAAAGLYVAWRKNFLGIQQVTAPLFTMLSAIAGIVRDDIGGIVSSLMGGDMSGAAAGASGMVGSIGTAIQEQGPAILDQVEAFGQRIITWVQEMAPRVADQAVEWGMAFIDWVTPYIPIILAKMSVLLNAFVAWIIETAPKVVAQVQTWANAFIDWVQPYIPVILAALAGIAMAVVAWVMQTAPEVAAQLITWANAFIDWIGPQIPVILATIQSIATTVLDWIVVNGPIILAQLADWAGAFLGWIVPLIGDLILELPGIIAAILGWILEVLPDIIATLLEWAAAFIDWVGPMIGDLIVALGELIASLLTWILEELIPAITAEIPGIVDAFMQFADDLVKQVGPALEDFLTAIYNFVTDDLVPSMLSFGEDVAKALIDGIKQGLSDLGQEAIDAARDLANDIKDEVGDFLGIHSPSTVFQGFGENIGQGLANGLSQTGQVMEKMRAMVQSIAAHGKQMVDPMFGVGMNIVQGLINGVQSQSSALYSTLYAMAANVKMIMESAFKIHSPSEIFEGYGQNMIAGLALGLGSMGSVDMALGALSSRTADLIPSSGGGSLGGPMVMIDRIEVSITPETIRQYPQAQDYGNEAAQQIRRVLQSAQRSRGGGVVNNG
jgi:TP901 family phage tail tape measure protein